MPLSQKRKPLVVVAGQVPPPIGGQNVMIAQLLSEMTLSTSWRTRHLPFFFTASFDTVRKFRFDKITKLLGVYVSFLKLLWKEGRPDLLIYPSGGPQTIPVIRDILLLPLLTACSRRVIVQFHAAGISERLAMRSGILETLLQLAYRPVTGAVVMTDFNRRDPEALGLTRVTVIPHQLVDLNPEGCLPQFSSKPIRLLYAGHLYEQKGTPQLVEAFGQIASQFAEVQLVLMGEFLPPYSREACEQQLRELGIEGRVILTGVLQGEAKSVRFREAAAFVFPSVAPYESFGLVLAEALMWGLPSVVTDWRGNADVAGRPPNGILVPAEGDLVANLAHGISQLLTRKSEWNEWGAKNRRRFLEIFCRNSDDSPYLQFVAEELARK